jgi:hypothetical protein
MPLTTKKIKKKWRIVEVESGDIAKNAAGTALDGGGHASQSAAQKQAAAVNIAQARKRGAKIPKQKNALS